MQAILDVLFAVETLISWFMLVSELLDVNYVEPEIKMQMMNELVWASSESAAHMMSIHVCLGLRLWRWKYGRDSV
jgi:hypothetical protein